MSDAACSPSASSIPTRVALVALLLLAAAAYLPVFENGFVYDDVQYLEENPFLGRGLSLAVVPAAFTSFHAGNWHPLTWLSHATDLAVFGHAPVGHHAVNLALHLLNAALVYLLLARLAGARWPALLVAALFALHPLNVESVAWVAERKNLLSTLFGLLSLLAYVAAARAGGRRRWLTAWLCMALSLLAKPMLVTLPLVMLALDAWPLRRLAGWWTVGEKIPFLALSAASGVATILAQGGGLTTLSVLPLWARAANAVLSTGRYLLHTVFPAGLSAFYPHPGTDLPWAGVAAAAAVLAAWALAAWRWRRDRPWLGCGLAVYLLTLTPVIGIVQTGAQAMADRYAYVPLLGVFTALAWSLAEIRGRARALVAGVTVALLAVLAALTFRQAQVWRDAETLFAHALAHTDDNATAQYNYGRALEETGRAAQALPHYREAVRIDPDYASARLNLGCLLDAQGRHEEALEHLGRAARLLPDSPQPPYNIGVSFLRRDRPGDALPWLLRSLARDPRNPRILLQVGLAFHGLGRTDEAARHFRLAIDSDPDPANPARRALADLERSRPGGR